MLLSILSMLLFIALHLACEAGDNESIEILINQGADSNLMDKTTQTPLMLACLSGNAHCVKPVSG